jgi:hypothetical protein
MTRPPLKNVGASVRARLTEHARQRDENAQLLMLRFAIERLIYPASWSKHTTRYGGEDRSGGVLYHGSNHASTGL